MRLRGALIGAIAATASIAFAGSASAAVEVGNNCVATKFLEDRTAIQLTRSSSRPEPLTVPADGVVTKWRVNVTLPTAQQFPLQLKVFRPVEGNRFSIVGESGVEVAGGGINIFDTRLPVKAGDRFGTAGKVLFCDSADPGDLIGRVGSVLAAGTTSEFDNQEEKSLVAVTGIVEPDADGDGFGDETQDFCPESAASQSACPPVIHQATLVFKKGAVLVLVTASARVSVTVGGTVKLPKKGTARLAPVTRTVEPPKIGRFLLKLPKNVKTALAGLPAGKSLKLTAKATVTDAIGRVATANENFKLKPRR
ncbi:MAG TPA: hypothetical protein VIT85_08635 [Solirubrobacterales bacterium]